jgi:uncharacterized LabA/DUF88 family protein
MNYNYIVIIDYPDLISRLIDLDVSKENISNLLSINSILNSLIKGTIRAEFGPYTATRGIEVFCSEKLPGPRDNKLSKDENDKIIERISKENAVYLNKIRISSESEKGVDVAIATRLIEASENTEILCLFGSDKDYIPVLEYLKRKGKYVITIGLEEHQPREILNLSYMFIDIKKFVNDKLKRAK